VKFSGFLAFKKLPESSKTVEFPGKAFQLKVMERSTMM
jgi:hypothetical protein